MDPSAVRRGVHLGRHDRGLLATWPILCQVQRVLWGSRSLAVAAMCGGLLAILIVPILVAVHALLSNVDRVPALVAWLKDAELPLAPGWVAAVPLVGEPAASTWNGIVAAGADGLVEQVTPYLRLVVSWLAHQAGGFALLLLQLVFVVLLSAVLYAGGEAWARWIRRFGMRLADAQGDRMVVLAGQAIRGVARRRRHRTRPVAARRPRPRRRGRSVRGDPHGDHVRARHRADRTDHRAARRHGVGLLPRRRRVGGGDARLVAVRRADGQRAAADPVRQGADLPMLLIVGGVIGGLVAFGIIGIFVGPVVLAVVYTLLDDWVASGPDVPDATTDAAATRTLPPPRGGGAAR